MRILHVIHRYWPARGGSEKFFIELSEQFAANGNDVTVFTTDAMDIQHFWLPGKESIKVRAEEHEKVRIERFPVRRFPKHPHALRLLGLIPGTAAKSIFSFPSPLLPSMLRRIGTKERYDIVHATALPYDSLLYVASRIARRQGIPFVTSPFFHLGESSNDEVSRHYTRPNQLRIINGSDRVFVQTAIEHDFLASHGCPEEKMVLLGMGITPSELEGGDGARFRQKYDLGNRSIVCYIGPRTYDKGTFTLIEAMEELWIKGDDTVLALAGTDIEDFKRFYAGLPTELKSNVILLDYISDEEKRDMLDACTLLTLPSRSDSFGIVLLEAWFFGKPVIGANAGGIPGLVRDHIDGVLVPFGDAAGLANALDRLLSDGEYAHRLGAAGRKKVLAEFTWADKYRTVSDLYEELTMLPANNRMGKEICP